MTTKRCCICKEQKPYSDFSRERARSDGLCSRCKSCVRTSNNSYRERHPTYGSDYYHSNTHKIKEATTKWRLDNHEHDLSVKRQYRKENNHVHAACGARRRSSIAQAMPGWYEHNAVVLLYKKRDDLSNLYGVEFEVDHIIPLIHPLVCGLHCLANLQLLDQRLNRMKSNKLQQDW